jgi:hypothetical protein
LVALLCSGLAQAAPTPRDRRADVVRQDPVGGNGDPGDLPGLQGWELSFKPAGDADFLRMPPYKVESVSVTLPAGRTFTVSYTICVRNVSPVKGRMLSSIAFAELVPPPPLPGNSGVNGEYKVHIVDLPTPLAPGRKGCVVNGQLAQTERPSTIWVLTPHTLTTAPAAASSPAR